MNNKLQKIENKFNQEQLDLIKRTVAKGTTNDEFAIFIHHCQRTGLDPFARQIHAIKRWDSTENRNVMSIQTGIDGYRLIAERSGKYAPGKDNIYKYDDDGKLVSATAFIMKKIGKEWFEISATAYYDEYVQFKKDGTPNIFWKTKPHIMLGKCAEALALRRAFPADLSGIYTHEEMMQVDSEYSEEKEYIPDETMTEQSQPSEKPKYDANKDQKSQYHLLKEFEKLKNKSIELTGNDEWYYKVLNTLGFKKSDQIPRGAKRLQVRISMFEMLRAELYSLIENRANLKIGDIKSAMAEYEVTSMEGTTLETLTWEQLEGFYNWLKNKKTEKE